MPRVWFEQKQTTFEPARDRSTSETTRSSSACSSTRSSPRTRSRFCTSARSDGASTGLRKLKDLGFIASFTPGRGFGVSRANDGHCLLTWRPEHWVRSKAADVKPDGFGRYLHPGGACEFYLEYDRGTEAFGALSRKLDGYLRLAAGWTKQQDLTGFPNLFIMVPEGVRDGEVGSALRHAIGRLDVRGSLATPFPLYVASEDGLTECGVLGLVWRHLSTDGDRLSLVDLPAGRRDLYRATQCLGRHFTDADSSHRRRIPPSRPRPDSPPCRPDMPLEAAARGRANRSRGPPSEQED